MVKTLNISSKKLGFVVNSRSSSRRVYKLAKNQYRYHFPESRNHQRESKSIGFIFPPGFYVLLALKRLKFFKFWVCLGVLRVNRKFINYFISSVFVSGLREPVVHLYFQFNFVSWMKGSESCLKPYKNSIFLNPLLCIENYVTN